MSSQETAGSLETTLHATAFLIRLQGQLTWTVVTQSSWDEAQSPEWHETGQRCLQGCERHSNQLFLHLIKEQWYAIHGHWSIVDSYIKREDAFKIHDCLTNNLGQRSLQLSSCSRLGTLPGAIESLNSLQRISCGLSPLKTQNKRPHKQKRVAMLSK